MPRYRHAKLGHEQKFHSLTGSVLRWSKRSMSDSEDRKNLSANPSEEPAKEQQFSTRDLNESTANEQVQKAATDDINRLIADIKNQADKSPSDR